MEIKIPQDSPGRKGQETGIGLKELREARGLSLDEVYKNTRISMVNLEALENGDLLKLPPPVYTRSYLKDYAKLLAMDAAQLISRYEKLLAALVKVDIEDADSCRERRSRFSKKFFASASLVAFFCFLVFFISLYANFKSTDLSVVDPVSVKVQGRPAVEIKNPPSPVKPEMTIHSEPTELPEKQQRASGIADPAVPLHVSRDGNKLASEMPPQTSVTSVNRLTIKARAETWLRIAEGSKRSYQILLKPGESVERFASEFAVDVGNAAGISLDFQGKTIDNLGKSGEVVHLRLP